VGAQWLRSEQASDQVPAQTLDVCGVASQGEIGYLLSQIFAGGVVRCRIEGTGGERGNTNRGAAR
jgi:carbamate kinase